MEIIWGSTERLSEAVELTVDAVRIALSRKIVGSPNAHSRETVYETIKSPSSVCFQFNTFDLSRTETTTFFSSASYFAFLGIALRDRES